MTDQPPLKMANYPIISLDDIESGWCKSIGETRDTKGTSPEDRCLECVRADGKLRNFVLKYLIIVRIDANVLKLTLNLSNGLK